MKMNNRMPFAIRPISLSAKLPAICIGGGGYNSTVKGGGSCCPFNSPISAGQFHMFSKPLLPFMPLHRPLKILVRWHATTSNKIIREPPSRWATRNLDLASLFNVSFSKTTVIRFMWITYVFVIFLCEKIECRYRPRIRVVQDWYFCYSWLDANSQRQFSR